MSTMLIALFISLLIAVAATGIWFFGRARRHARVNEEEVLAKRADAKHEGAQTRHEGGA